MYFMIWVMSLVPRFQRHQVQHYTGGLAKDTTVELRQFQSLSVPHGQDARTWRMQAERLTREFTQVIVIDGWLMFYYSEVYTFGGKSNASYWPQNEVRGIWLLRMWNFVGHYCIFHFWRLRELLSLFLIRLQMYIGCKPIWGIKWREEIYRIILICIVISIIPYIVF